MESLNFLWALLMVAEQAPFLGPTEMNFPDQKEYLSGKMNKKSYANSCFTCLA